MKRDFSTHTHTRHWGKIVTAKGEAPRSCQIFTGNTRLEFVSLARVAEDLLLGCKQSLINDKSQGKLQLLVRNPWNMDSAKEKKPQAEVLIHQRLFLYLIHFPREIHFYRGVAEKCGNRFCFSLILGLPFPIKERVNCVAKIPSLDQLPSAGSCSLINGFFPPLCQFLSSNPPYDFICTLYADITHTLNCNI